MDHPKPVHSVSKSSDHLPWCIPSKLAIAYDQLAIDDYMSIVCLVGNQIIYHPDTPELFQVLQDVNVRMIAYGGSNNNISLLVNTSDKLETLQKLQRYVFEGDSVMI